MTDNPGDTLAEKDRQIAQLEAEVVRSQVSRQTGVPIGLLANGQTAEEIERIATDALGWRAEAAPSRPQTAALPASIVTSATRIEGPKQITLGEFSRLSPQERMQAVRAGLLMNEGVAPPRLVKRTGH